MTSDQPARLETWKDIAAFVALFGAPAERLAETCIRTLGPEKWQALVEVAGTVYRIDVARYARREYPWSWEVSSAGMHVRGGDEQTIGDVGSWMGEALADLLPAGRTTHGRGTT